uniref:non-specific serine/threonine protein kinase n=1 Tax=Eutreptiella gymnastica TaxID=73025 RepID=A0A7S1N695_9EUGL|mmetsp:Transcript_123878/g.214760  ORF Transcript_123878/g.214760 Transcript_123878/m.214760 type:complete len:365 (+) Transcript_123878:36-1130(+)
MALLRKNLSADMITRPALGLAKGVNRMAKTGVSALSASAERCNSSLKLAQTRARSLTDFDLGHHKEAKLLVGRYEFEQTIGHGGFGEVFEAYDVIDDMSVAIKKVQWSKWFNIKKHKVAQNELGLLKRYKHPCIVEYKDAFVKQGVYHSELFLVMELCDRDLHFIICNSSFQLGKEDVRLYMKSLSSAVEYLHRMQVIHRDIKPSNVLLTKDGVAKVSDFGLACVIGAAEDGRRTDREMRRTVAGTPQYFAPELYTGIYDEGVDIWGLGCIFYELCVRQIFDRDMWSAMKPKVDAHFWPQMVQMLETNPAKRPDAEACLRFFSKALPLSSTTANRPFGVPLDFWIAGAGILVMFLMGLWNWYIS